MNIKLSKELLCIVHHALDEFKIEHFVTFGTLLGIVREGNLIEKDGDVDLGMKANPFRDDYKLWLKFLDYLWKDKVYCQSNWDNFWVLNFRRLADEHLDLYWHNKINDKYVISLRGMTSNIPERYLDHLDTIEFMNRKFNCPHNTPDFLAFLYGARWKRPGNYKSTADKIQRTETRIIESYNLIPYYDE